MPLLSGSGGRFAPSKIDQRKKPGLDISSDELQIPEDIEINLGGQTLTFSDGRWLGSGTSGSMSGSKREAQRKLEEENNLLKAKLELLMDMLTEVTAQSRLQAKEVKMLRAKLRK